MANCETGFNWMLDNEDSQRLYESVPDPVQVEPNDSPDVVAAKDNAHAISGCNSFWFPKWYSMILLASQAQKGAIVENFYKTEFWNSWFDQLVSDELTKRYFDCSVNPSLYEATKILQGALVSLGLHILEDGEIGPQTVTAANHQLDMSLVPAFKAMRLGYLQNLVTKYPRLAKYLGTAEHPGPWWIRATK